MSLLRFAARTLLASHFVINGVKAVRQPDDFAEVAGPVMDKVVPPLKSALPAQVADLLPADAAGWVRVCGATQIVGGVLLATGIGRRLGSAALASTMLPQILTNNPLKASTADRAKLSGDVALLGGVVLAALDTEGQPSLAWKLRARRELTNKHKKTQANAQKLANKHKKAQASAHKIAKRGRKQVASTLS